MIQKFYFLGIYPKDIFKDKKASNKLIRFWGKINTFMGLLQVNLLQSLSLQNTSEMER
jgi:hypothetical protein